MSTDLQWSGQFTVKPQSRTPAGDKITLPQSALEQLLSAAAITEVADPTSGPHTTSFDPFNPYSYAAERLARSQFVDRQQQLPDPLTFRLVNPINGRVVYAGIREFSAGDDEVGLSLFLKQALGLGDDGHVPHAADDPQNNAGISELGESADGLSIQSGGEEARPRITVHAKQLPKGTYVRLRPLEAGYEEDWKSLLERYLRNNFTTLTNGEILSVTGGRGEQFRFLIDKLAPDGEAICVIDTDLEVDIEPLNEEQARETLQRRLAKTHRAAGTAEGSSVGGVLELEKEEQGQVLPGEYVDYEFLADRSRGVQIEAEPVDDEKEVELFMSPFTPHQRAKPRNDEYVFGDLSSRPAKRIRLNPTNVELEDAEALWISVHAYQSPDTEKVNAATPYHIRVRPLDSATDDAERSDHNDERGAPDEVQCKNCHQFVPQRTLFLHENFCLRNNILCPKCNNTFLKNSSQWKNHWHCPHDDFYGNTSVSHLKHDDIFHTPRTCLNCNYQASNLPDLSHHRTTTCPGKLILCQFCHLLVPQQGESDPSPHDPEVILSGLTPHELVDGGRTTECHLCAKIIRLRDMKTHLKHHEFERLSRPPPQICRNRSCGRTLDGVGKNGDLGAGKRMGQGAGNDLGLCSICYGPLYVSMYDPEGKSMKRRVERRYLTQILTGCGKSWCRNEFCKTGRKNTGLATEGELITTKDAIPMVKPFVDGLMHPDSPLHFCVDEASQHRRVLAEMIAAEGVGDSKGKGKGKAEAADGNETGYELEWCVAALEAEGGDLDRARGWLRNWANPRSQNGST